MAGNIKVAAAHPPLWREISHRIDSKDEVLRLVDGHIARILELADRAADAGAIAVAYPEDTLGLLGWQSAHLESQKDVLDAAVEKLLVALSKKAAERSIYCIACNDMSEGDDFYNTAVLIGRDGKEIGRYHKVTQPFAERWKKHGTHLPVFETEDLGTVGLSICYDMVFPETTRALALAGADVVFDLSMGGASVGNAEVNRAAFITRAADNGLYLVVVWRGQSKFISPLGEIFAKTRDNEPLTMAEFNPHTGRESDLDGPDFNDHRARLFAERIPEAYAILTDPEPPALKKLGTADLPPMERYWRRSAEALTTGEDRFKAAEKLMKEGRREEAAREFELMAEHFQTTWIARASRTRLEELRKASQEAEA